MNRASIWISFAITGFAVVIPRGMADEQIKTIELKLKNQLSKLKYIQYECECAIFYPKDSLTNPNDAQSHKSIREGFPEKDLNLKAKVNYTLCFDGSRKISKHYVGPRLNISTGKFVEIDELIGFDGESTHQTHAKDSMSKPRLNYSKGNQIIEHTSLLRGIITIDDTPILMSNGIISRSNPLDIQIANQLTNLESFSVSTHDASSVTLETTSREYDQFEMVSFDKKNHYLVSKWSIGETGKTSIITECDYQKIDGHTVLKNWTISNMQGKGKEKLRYKKIFSVNKVTISTECQNSSFSADAKPNDLVINPDNLQTLMYDENMKLIALREGQSNIKYFIYAGIGLIGAFMLFIMYNRRSKTSRV
jgi:hypothetical protein